MGVTLSGETTTETRQYNFISFPTLFVVGIIGFAVVIILISLFLTLRRASSSLGLTKCPKCNHVFSRTVSKLHVGSAYRNTCPECGHVFWASKLKETTETKPLITLSEEDTIEKIVEESKYEEE